MENVTVVNKFNNEVTNYYKKKNIIILCLEEDPGINKLNLKNESTTPLVELADTLLFIGVYNLVSVYTYKC